MDETADSLDTSGTSPLDVFSQGGTFEPAASANDNPSNGLDVTSLFNNLIGTAGASFQAAQNSQTAQSIAQAQIAAQAASPADPIAFLTGTTNGRTILLLGVGLLALALILRK